jgi:hypothetical protein
MCRRNLKSLLAAGLAVLAFQAQATEPTAEAKKLAAEIPIFDMHMHVYAGLTPVELETRMNQNNVRWGGGVGAVNPQADIAPFKAHLGSRYFPTVGQPEFAASYMKGGVGAMGNPENPMMRRAIESGRRLIPAGQVVGFGELILNNQNSHANPQFRRKAQIDSPVVREMFAIAAEHGAMVQIHLESDSSSLRELASLLKEFSNVPVVVAHCLSVTSGPKEMEELFVSYPQVSCELSARSQTAQARRSEYQVFGDGFAKSNWLASIEKFSDRYMVGTDATSESVNYDDEIRQIRKGLLARLSPETMLKVANGNAKRLMRVKD